MAIQIRMLHGYTDSGCSRTLIDPRPFNCLIGPRQVARYELIAARSPLIFTLSSPQNTPDTHVVSLMIITVHIIIPKEVI